MMIRKLTDPIFIHFSKIYIYFYQDKKRYWRIFPSLILATIASINWTTISFFLEKIDGFNQDLGILVPLFFVFFFLFLYSSIKYDYVKNHIMSNKWRVIITIIIVVDLVINFTLTTMLRNGKL